MFKFASFIIILTYGLSLLANDTYNFSLKFNNQISNNKTKYYFQMIENGLSLGVRLGINRPVTIEFIQGQSLKPDCRNILSTDLSHPDSNEDRVFVNQSILELIREDLTGRKNKYCSFNELLIKSLEQSISALKNAYDFSQPYSKEMKSKVNQCHLDQFMHTNKQDGTYEPTIKGCLEVLKLDERKQKYRKLKKNYEKKLLYMENKEKIVIDTTSLSLNGLEQFNVCSTDYTPDLYTSKNQPIKILGFAVVYMAPAFNASQFGHVAERYVYCIENRMMDVMYEYGQFRLGDFADFKKRYQEQLNLDSPDSSLAKADERFMVSLLKKSYIRTTINPASWKEYGVIQLSNNRDIVEVWLNVEPQDVYENYLKSWSLYKHQKELVAQRNVKDWPVYEIFSNNCTHPIKDKLNAIGGDYSIDDFNGFLPEFIFKFLKKRKTDKIILYPGQRTLRQYEMLNAGRPLTFENLTFLSTTLDPGENKFMLIQPDYRGFEGVFLNRGASLINFLSGLVETSWGVITSPLSLFTDNHDIGLSSINSGLKNSLFSLTEFFGIVRLRHPGPTQPTPHEIDYIKNVLPFKEPAILGYLYSKL